MGATRSDVRDGVVRDARMLAELDFQIKDNHRLTAENAKLISVLHEVEAEAVDAYLSLQHDCELLAGELDDRFRKHWHEQVQNEKLRQLARSAWKCIHSGLSCSDCRMTAGGCTLQSAMRELGVELPVGGVMPIPRGNGKNPMHEKVVRCRDCSGRMSERVTIDQDWVRDLIERNSAEWGGNRREFYNSAYQMISEEIRALMDDYAMAQSAELRDVARKMLRDFVNCDIELRRHGKTFLPERYVARLSGLGVEI